MLSIRMPMRQILKNLCKHIKPTMYTSGILFAHCLSEKPGEHDKLILEQPDINKLTYEFMIKQSTLEAANSTTQTLTVVCMAITSLSAEYRALLDQLISLLTDTINCEVSDTHWDTIIEARTLMEAKKDKLMKLTSYVDYVHKMAVAASELSYLSGMDTLSNMLCERIENALNNVKIEIGKNLEAEKAYRYIQEQCIKDSKETV